MLNVPELKTKVISFMQRNGPSLPIAISKQINENMIFSGAVLSELVSNKKVMISNAKIGSSPVYYLPGQEYKLSQTLYPYMREIHKKAHDLIRKNVVLRDKELEPWQRVALRELKDFAVMLTLYDGDIFWRWYLTSDGEAEKLIKTHLGIKEEEPEKAEPETKEIEEKLEIVPQPAPQPKKVEKPSVKPSIKTDMPKKYEPREKQQIIKKQFDLGILTNFFNEKRIEVTDQKQIDKKEVNFRGEIDSNLGLIKIFIKFKDKKKISDSDLITAHNESMKLPLYFISTGDLTKKAQKYIEENFLLFEKLK